MAFSYIQEDELLQRFRDAQKFMMPLFEPMDEWERIARNLPHPGIDKSLPRVTDGTLAALIQEQPKRIIQQIPTGKVKANDRWLEIMGDYILSHEIIPNSNSVAALIQKCWAVTSKTLTYGSQPALVQFVNRGEYFGTDFTLPYVRDVLLEPGKLSDRDSNVIFLRSWYQPNQIDAIIKKEQMLSGKAKDRGESYESGWNLKLLAELKDQVKQKDVRSQTPNERGKQNNKGFIEIVHCFQRGIGATFYSFAPDLDGQVVRTKKNPDPRGMIPIHYMYANVDLSNPLGRGSVELSGGMQNLLDSEVQSYQYMRSLLMNPPLEVKGNIPSSTLKYAPNALWKLGSDPNASVTPVQLETSSLNQFPQNYGLIKSQILNLNSSTDTSVSSEAGNPGFSKTDAGVKSQQMRLGVSDNYMRRQFEAWFEEIIETEINLYFAERHGTQDLTVDEETADKLREIDPSYVGMDNVVRIDYDSETPRLTFQADPTSSTEADNTEQVEQLKELLQETSADPLIGWRLQQEGYQFKMGEAYKQLFERMGIKNLDKIIVEIPKDQQQPPSQMPVMDKPKVTIAFDDLVNLGIPEAVMGALSDAGIDVPIESVQQAIANKQAMDQQKTQIEQENAQVSAISAANDHANAMASNDLAEQQAHLDAIDMAHKHAIDLANQEQSRVQADRSHALAVKASNTPKVAK